MTQPTRRDAFAVWLKIGVLSFGGPAAQIALMHRLLVDEKGWLSERRFLNALSFCMLLPGPEAMQLATYAGWRLHGVAGGLVAGLLFVIPGALVVGVLSALYALYGELAWVNAVFFGIQAAVVVIVVEALLRVSRKALRSSVHWQVAGAAFVAIFFFSVPFPVIIGAAALFGAVMLGRSTSPGSDTDGDDALSRSVATPGGLGSTLVTIALWLLIWCLPFPLLWLAGADAVLLDVGLFFSRLAVVTFGGAYAVLAYLAQDVVGVYGWLSAGEMMDGLGLAETTPGPLILVTEFVGFLAGYRSGGMPLALLAALLTLWVTFVPCFLWIFAGAPYIEWLGSRPRLAGALSAITAAVVGVILNLSIWFALHVWFADVQAVEAGWIKSWWPTVSTLNLSAVALTGVCAVLLLRWHWPLTRVLALAAVGGFLVSLL